MTFADFSVLLDNSRVTAAFRSDLEAYASRRLSERITASARCPRVKVLRVIAQLLSVEPTLAVDCVHIEAVSGCADFVGNVTATEADGREHAFDFDWNCEWKAIQRGYVDAFGFADQIRAAEEFGWQCFARWVRVARAAVSA